MREIKSLFIERTLDKFLAEKVDKPWPARLVLRKSKRLLLNGLLAYRGKDYRRARHLFRLAAWLPYQRTVAQRFALVSCYHCGEQDHESAEFIILGTTGLCNASCIHCPTGKLATAGNPRVPMAMDLFEKIIRGIAKQRMLVNGHLAFGLFGDALVDPQVVERARLVRKYLPDVRLVLNTNGAAFDRVRHAELVELVDDVTLHCESLQSEVYDKLMAPLRLRNVLPKLEQVLASFESVQVSIPISRLNLAEAPAMADWFRERGAADVHFDPLFSRCAEDTSVFDRLTHARHQVACLPTELNSIVIDCDGVVLACCQDFQRLQPLGDLAKQTLDEALSDPRRRAMRDVFAAQRHSEIVTCNRCFCDEHPHKLLAATPPALG